MKTKKRSARDLISSLPCDIIENILKRLTLRDGARTSILSREWRYKWSTLPDLDLKYSQLDLSYNQDLNTVINKILMLHQGPVKEFEVDYMDLESCHYLHLWFDLLSKYHLQRLLLHWCLGPKDYGRLPSNFFSFSQLRYLSLSKCVLRLPSSSSFKVFSHLVSLDLQNVKIKINKLSRLISKSPLLEQLVIINKFRSFKTFRIDASKLKKFYFDGFVSSIYFVNVPLLEEVHIALIGRSNATLPKKVKQDNFMKSLAQFSSITKLVLRGCFLQSVALDGVWQTLSYNMNNLKILALDISSYELVEVSCAICLLRSAPNLESLVLVVDGLDEQMNTVLFLEQQQEHDISFSCLKEVMIWWVDCKEPDFELVKLIFACSPALEKFIIPPAYEGSCLWEALFEMPRASPEVEISLDYSDIESRVFTCVWK